MSREAHRDGVTYTADRVRHQPLWGSFCFDIDGAPAGDLRGLTKARPLPGHLRLVQV